MTERLVLREMVPGDVDKIYQLYENPQVTRYMEGLFEDVDQELVYIRSYYDTVYRFYGYGMWLITLRDGTVIGRAGVENNADGEFELGYMLGAGYWHQGYAMEACEGILKYIQENLGLDRKDIICRIDRENEASLRLAEKLGVAIRLIS